MGILKNVLALIAGFVIGSVVNFALVIIGPTIIVPPAGADLTTSEGITLAMPLMELKHFIFPFLAHAVGTLVGAIVAARIAVSHQMSFAIAVGVFFLIGGIINMNMIPHPTWFAVVDGVFAYIPMGYLGGWMVLNYQVSKTE